MEVDQQYDCKYCDEKFSMFGELMMHKKTLHLRTQVCHKYVNRTCHRGSKDCWYMHELPEGKQKLDFQQASTSMPPDRMKSIVEDFYKIMKTMETMVTHYSQKQ